MFKEVTVGSVKESSYHLELLSQQYTTGQWLVALSNAADGATALEHFNSITKFPRVYDVNIYEQFEIELMADYQIELELEELEIELDPSDFVIELEPDFEIEVA